MQRVSSILSSKHKQTFQQEQTYQSTKNAHFHTYVRMGLYIRMCSSIQAYAQTYTYVCEFLRNLMREIPHAQPKLGCF